MTEDLTTSEVENTALETTQDTPNTTDASEAPQTDAAVTDADTPTEANSEAEVESTSEADTDTEKQEKRPSRAQERIRTLVSERNEAQAQAAQSIERLTRLREGLQLPENFDDLDYNQQQQLLTRQAINMARAEDAAYEANAANSRANQKTVDTFAIKAETARAKIPDFDVVVNNPNLPINATMAEIIVESDRAPELAYHLGKNPAEAARISVLPLHRQGAELAKLESKLSPPSNARKVSAAPPPPKTIGGGAAPATKDPADMSMPEYLKWHNQREAKKAS